MPSGAMATGVLCVLLAGCNVFESLEDCQADAECALGQRCHATGHFCEADPGPIQIGVLLPLEGTAAPLGQDLMGGLTIAQEIINAAGGVAGRPIEYVVLHDRPNEVTEAHMIELIDRHRVAGIIAGTDSTVALIAQAVASPRQVVVISPMATWPELSSAEPATDRYFFRTMGETRRGEAWAMGLYATVGGPFARCPRTVIIHDDTPFTRGYRDAFREVFDHVGGCVPREIIIPTSVKTSYEEDLAGLVALRPDCGLLLSFSDVGTEVLRQSADAFAADTTQDWAAFHWLGSSGFHLPQFLELGQVVPGQPTPHVGEGIFGSDVDTTPASADYFRFRELYNEHFGLPLDQDVPANVTNIFDAAILLALAIEHAGSVADRVGIRDGLWAVTGTSASTYGPDQIGEALSVLRLRREIGANACTSEPGGVPCAVHYRGASSPLIFDDYGTVSVPSLIWSLEDGAFTMVARYTQVDYDAFEATGPTPGGCPR